LKLYIDSSAAVKLVRREQESESLRAFCIQPDVELVASDLLETELRRIAARQELPQAAVTDVLAAVNVYELSRSAYVEAGMLAGANLRSLDALHLVGALRLNVDAVLVYDKHMTDAAVEHGFRILAPA
jgi:predicted nucleic acid-binding protein